MPTHKVEWFHCNGVVDVVLEGQAGPHTPMLDLEVNRIIACRPREVRIDLTRLEFISSAALGTLVALRRAVRRHGGSVIITAAHDHVLDALQRTRLDEVFGLTPAVVAA